MEALSTIKKHIYLQRSCSWYSGAIWNPGARGTLSWLPFQERHLDHGIWWETVQKYVPSHIYIWMLLFYQSWLWNTPLTPVSHQSTFYVSSTQYWLCVKVILYLVWFFYQDSETCPSQDLWLLPSEFKEMLLSLEFLRCEWLSSLSKMIIDRSTHM